MATPANTVVEMASEAAVQKVAAGGEGRAAAGGGKPSSRALEAPEPRRMEAHPAWPMIARLPVMLSVRIPLRGFRVCDLLNLRADKTIVSAWAVTEDVPLMAGQSQLCWGEFEVVERNMALRLTRLA